jgi:hypothetical protein
MVIFFLVSSFITYKVSSAPTVSDPLIHEVSNTTELQESFDNNALEKALQEHESLEDVWNEQVDDSVFGGGLLSGPGANEVSGAIEITNAPTPAPTNKTDFEKWAYDNAPILKFTRKDGAVVDIHACEVENIVTTTIFGAPVRVHKEAIPYLHDVETAWQASGGNNFYKIPGSIADSYAMGGYACRHVRGSSTAISNHSYGVAFDVNPTTNPYVIFVNSLSEVSGASRTIDGISTRYNPPTLYVASQDQSKFISERDHYTDMPESFVSLWNNAGWGWGGIWSSKKDAMHFSLVTAEGGRIARFGASSSGSGFIILLPSDGAVDTVVTSFDATTSSGDTASSSDNSDGGRPWDNGEKPGGGKPKDSDIPVDDTTDDIPIIDTPPGNGGSGSNSGGNGNAGGGASSGSSGTSRDHKPVWAGGGKKK